MVATTDNGAPWGSLIEEINQSLQIERYSEHVVARDGVRGGVEVGGDRISPFSLVFAHPA